MQQLKLLIPIPLSSLQALQALSIAFTTVCLQSLWALTIALLLMTGWSISNLPIA